MCPHCRATGIDRDVLAAAIAAKDAANGTSGPNDPLAGVGESHAPLPPRIVEQIKRIVSENRHSDKEYEGKRSQYFSDAPSTTGILIGLDISTDDANGEKHIGAVRPIFLTATGKQVGRWHGTVRGKPERVEARPGYAVIELSVSVDSRLESLQIHYRAYDDEGFLAHGNPAATFGTPNRDRLKSVPLARDQGFIIALNGSTIGVLSDLLNGIGVTVVPISAIKPPPATTTTSRPRPVAPNQPDIALVNKVASANVPGDRDARHPPLSAELADYIKDAVSNQKTVDVGEANFGGQAAFRTVPTDGGLLIGFDITYGRFIDTPLVHAFRPIFLTRKGKVAGPVAGVGGSGGVHVEAKPGYAIGRMYCKAGLYLHTITITYMKITPTGLDPKDSYEGACYGGDGGSGDEMIGGGGTMIVGVLGSAKAGGELLRLAGVTLAPKPANP